MRRRSSVHAGHERLLLGDGYRSPLGTRIPLTALIQTLAVAEHLNFRHAANALGVSQSSVSARVKTLEDAQIPGSFLAELIGQYRQDYFRVEVEITEATARDAVMQLRAGRLDISFVVGTPQIPQSDGDAGARLQRPNAPDRHLLLRQVRKRHDAPHRQGQR